MPWAGANALVPTYQPADRKKEPDDRKKERKRKRVAWKFEAECMAVENGDILHVELAQLKRTEEALCCSIGLGEGTAIAPEAEGRTHDGSERIRVQGTNGQKCLVKRDDVLPGFGNVGIGASAHHGSDNAARQN